jgi:hypothetical protein
LIRLIAAEINKRSEYCGLQKVLEIIKSHPEWQKINDQFERNEGYAQSLKQDQAS